MKVTYLYHSGFSVETEHTVLLFDYYTARGRKSYFDPTAYGEKEIFVFVSHAHEDHYDARILDWGNLPHVHYILSFDVRTEAGFQGDALAAEPNKSYTFHGIQIQTLRSNDEGVAFLVKADGKTIYHAGDLNWWHWNGEPETFNQEIAESYTTEINRLKGGKIDVAFVPADLRLEDKYFWAVDYFLGTVGAAVLFPMHFWGKYSVCGRLKQLGWEKTVQEITKENQSFLL